jgi:MFS family permease
LNTRFLELQYSIEGKLIGIIPQTIVATAIPKMTDEFGGIKDEGWYGSAFFITLGSFQAAWGKAYKYFPLKISFLISIFIFEVGSLICGKFSLPVQSGGSMTDDFAVRCRTQ